MKVALVEWVDSSYTQPGWQDRETLDAWAQKPDVHCFSAGIVIHQTEEHIVLALSVQPVEYADCFKIPTRQILQIAFLGMVGDPDSVEVVLKDDD